MEIGIALAVIGGIAILMYNSLIGKKNQVENAFGGMDVQLGKRYDLIPNLISTVKTYMAHEKDVLENVTKMRSEAISGKLSDDELVEMDNKISHAVRGIMVSCENYPDLKASSNFVQLQHTFVEVESQISASRRAYNAAVTEFNNGVEMFPTSIFAKMMGMKRKAVFEIPEYQRENVNAAQLFSA